MDLLVDRLAVSGLPSTVADLVLAAVLGEDELTAAIGGDKPSPPPPAASAGDVPAMFLSGISVEGFRGIAGRSRLGFTPGPGLTLVVGRNGSGKSSFAEAAELALTGTSHRWAGRTSVWRDGWACLHHSGARAVEVRLHSEGVAGETAVRTRWQPEDGLAEGAATIQLPAGKETPLAQHGLLQATSTWRPFLSYNELGGLLEDGPSKLYDAISSVLGIDEWAEAEKRLKRAAKDIGDALKASELEAKRLKSLADAVEDDRAAAMATALRKPKAPQLDELEALAGGVVPADGDLQLLEHLAVLPPVDLDEVARRAAELRSAAAAVGEFAGSDAERAGVQAGLLEVALGLHKAHGQDLECPVCSTPAMLTDEWAAQARTEVDRLHSQAAAMQTATSELRRALDAARNLVRPIPPTLLRVPAEMAQTLEVDALAATWADWVATPADPGGLANHLEAIGPDLAAQLEATSAAATAELRRRQDVWQPLAIQLAAWLPAARQATTLQPLVDALKSAEKWLQGEANTVRNERLEPIADEVIELWNTMRHNSNVTVERLHLTGANTRRQLAIEIAVDGVAGAGLPVMSQGELHALALSLFLPRATMAASPFRFVLIDDPVQAMDAARVDGLARNLSKTAANRQVIVFTHDERLPAACRRLGIAATVLEVNRSEQSRVAVRRRTSPALDYLDDARAVLATDDYPDEARRRVIPGLCRHAVEIACVEAARTKLHAQGRTHDEIEAAIDNAGRLRPKLALALMGDANRQADVRALVARRWGASTNDSIDALNRGSHELIDTNPRRIVDDTEKLVNALAGADGPR